MIFRGRLPTNGNQVGWPQVIILTRENWGQQFEDTIARQRFGGDLVWQENRKPQAYPDGFLKTRWL